MTRSIFLVVMAAGLAAPKAAAFGVAEDYTTTTDYWDTTTTYPYWDTTTASDCETTTTVSSSDTTTTTGGDPTQCPAGWVDSDSGCYLLHYTEVRG